MTEKEKTPSSLPRACSPSAGVHAHRVAGSAKEKHNVRFLPGTLGVTQGVMGWLFLRAAAGNVAETDPGSQDRWNLQGPLPSGLSERPETWRSPGDTQSSEAAAGTGQGSCWKRWSPPTKQLTTGQQGPNSQHRISLS